jgi:SAM-dependent methyltransferase
VRLNKVCNIEDWALPEMTSTMRRLLPHFLEQSAQWPTGMEHRKHWEFAQLLNGLHELKALDPSGMVLAVAAGQEAVIYELTNRVRWVFATDIYGAGSFTLEADAGILFDPDRAATCPYNRRRLVVQHMDALDLRYEDETFDIAYSLSSIEHFGGMSGVANALAEQCRVVKAGGIVAFTTEVIVNEAPPLDEDNLVLFRPEQMADLCRRVRPLRLVEPIDFGVTTTTMAEVISLDEAVRNDARHSIRYPHVVLEHRGRLYTSVAVFLRKEA